MASVTERIKTESQKRSNQRWRNFKNQEVLPSWWQGATAVFSVVGVLGISGLLIYNYNNDQPVTVTQTAPVAQNINPFPTSDKTIIGEGAAAYNTAAANPSTSTAAVGNSYTDTNNTKRVGAYQERTPASVKVIGSSINANLPQGALNIASDTAKAIVDGNWDGIPINGNQANFPELPNAQINYNRIYLKEPLTETTTTYKLVLDAEVEGDTRQLIIEVGSINGTLQAIAP